MRTFVLLCALAVLGGCTDTVYMRNAATGEVATCGPYSNFGLYALTVASRERECVQSYEHSGFQRTPH